MFKKLKNLKLEIKNIIECGLYLLFFLLPFQTRYIGRSFEIGQGNMMAVLEYGNISLYGTDILLILLLIFLIIEKMSFRPESCHSRVAGRSGGIAFASEENSVCERKGSLGFARDDKERKGSLGFARDDKEEARDRLLTGGEEAHSLHCQGEGKGGVIGFEKRFWFLVAGLDLFIFISIFLASDKILALYRYGVFLLGVGLAFLIIKASYNFNKLLIAFFGGIFLSACLAIWQFLNQGAFANKWLGLSAHAPSDLGASVIETLSMDGVGERWLRAYGSFDHPNILGGVLAVGLLLLIPFFINLSSRAATRDPEIFSSALSLDSGSRAGMTHEKSVGMTEQKPETIRKKFIIYHLLFIICLLGLIFSFSRAAALSFVAAFTLLFIINIWQKNIKTIKRLFVFFVLGIILFSATFLMYQNLFLTRLSGEGRLEEKSNTERKSSLKDAKEIIGKNWLFGVGIGNYALELKKENPKRYAWELQPPHNTFVLILAEIGIFGFLFFAGILIRLFWLAIKNKNIIALPILLALVIILSLDHWLWSLHFGVLFFWFVVGICLKFSSRA